MSLGALPSWAAVSSRPNLSPWVMTQRKHAWDHLLQHGLPSRKQEAWRYLNIRSLSSELYQPLANPESVVEVVHLPEKVTQYSLTDLDREDVHGLQAHVGSIVPAETSGFVSLNTANLSDVTMIHVAGPVASSEVIELRIDGGQEDVPSIAHPRLQVALASGAEATVLLRLTGGGSQDRLTNLVTELHVGENAKLEFVVLQDAQGSHHTLHTVGATVASNGTLRTQNFAVGGSVARSEVRVSLDGTGAETWVDGLYLGRGEQQLDQYTVIDHQADRTVSGELYKGILDDHSVGTFQGRILINPDVRFCSTDQMNRNIVLSEGAIANTKPQLEIANDEVRATHGATVGQLDAEGLHYLRTRGLDQKTAQALLLMGFVREVVDRVQSESVRDTVWSEMLAALQVDAAVIDIEQEPVADHA